MTQKEKELASQVEKLKAELEQARKGRAITEGLDRAKLEKVLLIIGHITANRANEAIQELLKPLPFVFALDIRFADDQTRIKVEEETLERLKKIVIDVVQGARLKPTKEESNEDPAK